MANLRPASDSACGELLVDKVLPALTQKESPMRLTSGSPEIGYFLARFLNALAAARFDASL